MAQNAGRIACSRCGANNFDTVTSCWKCSAPLGAAPAGAVLPPLVAPNPAPLYAQERPLHAAPLPAPLPTAVPGDQNMAKRAAVLLGLTLPFIGLPVGWVFMMIPDRGRQTIGRWCATASIISLFIHIVLFYAVAASAVPLMLKLLGPAIGGATQRAAGSDRTPIDSGSPSQ